MVLLPVWSNAEYHWSGRGGGKNSNTGGNSSCNGNNISDCGTLYITVVSNCNCHPVSQDDLPVYTCTAVSNMCTIIFLYTGMQVCVMYVQLQM